MIDREALRTSLQDCVYINQQVCDEITRNRANPGQARTEPSARNTNDITCKNELLFGSAWQPMANSRS